MYKELIQFIIRQADPNDKTGDATKQNLTLHKHLEISHFHV